MGWFQLILIILTLAKCKNEALNFKLCGLSNKCFWKYQSQQTMTYYDCYILHLTATKISLCDIFRTLKCCILLFTKSTLKCGTYHQFQWCFVNDVVYIKNIKTYSSCLFNDSHYIFWVNQAILFVVNMICLKFQIKTNDTCNS